MEAITADKMAIYDATSKMHADTEKAEEQPTSPCAPLPYARWERFIEGFVHPLCALLLSIFTIGIVLIGIHIIWIAGYHKDYKTLVPAAFHNNKAVDLPEDTKFNFNIRDLGLSMGLAAAGIMAALGALFLALLTWKIPRERLFHHPLPLLDYMNHLSHLVAYQTALSLALYTYLFFFHDLEPENASGCYTYTNSRGRLVAKCSIVSAACHTSGWPASIQLGHAAHLCTETRIVKTMTTAIIPCSAALLIVYQHMENTMWRYTTPEQRLELAERKKEEQERQKAAEDEKIKKNKWYYTAWGILSVLVTLWNIRTIVVED